MSRDEWLASLKAGDEVAVGRAIFTIARRTPKLFFLSDGRRFDAEGRGAKSWNHAPRLDDAGPVRRLLTVDAIDAHRQRGGSYARFHGISDAVLVAVLGLLDAAKEQP